MGQKKMLTDVRYVNTGMKSWKNIHPVKVISENKKSDEFSPRHFNKKQSSAHDGLPCSVCYLFVSESTMRNNSRFWK